MGERIRVILDCDDNTLSFEKNYEFLGVAFRGMDLLLALEDSFCVSCHLIAILLLDTFSS